MNHIYINRLIFCSFILLAVKFSFAQNPISSRGLSIADSSAKVWKDGKLYVCGFSDESFSCYFFCNHWFLLTADLLNWECLPNAFASKESYDKIFTSDALIIPTDIAYKNSTYYLYYCQNRAMEGIDIRKTPRGPNTNSKTIYLKQKNQIYSVVLVDYEGQSYYIWRKFQAKIAKLNPKLTEFDTTTIVDNAMTEKKHYFHEDDYMANCNGNNYFVYGSGADFTQEIHYKWVHFYLLV